MYAISISHARNIADFYRMHGINTVAIDSKTPARLRKQFIEDFKRGKTQVLVNVDVFSEGFDCPDVEFVQMARPTFRWPNTCSRWGADCGKQRVKTLAC